MRFADLGLAVAVQQTNRQVRPNGPAAGCLWSLHHPLRILEQSLRLVRPARLVRGVGVRRAAEYPHGFAEIRFAAIGVGTRHRFAAGRHRRRLRPPRQLQRAEVAGEACREPPVLLRTERSRWDSARRPHSRGNALNGQAYEVRPFLGVWRVFIFRRPQAV